MSFLIKLVYFLSDWGFRGGSDCKEFASNARDASSIPGLGRSLGEGNGADSSILAWGIPWTIAWWAIVHGSQRIGHNWVTNIVSVRLERRKKMKRAEVPSDSRKVSPHWQQCFCFAFLSFSLGVWSLGRAFHFLSGSPATPVASFPPCFLSLDSVVFSKANMAFNVLNYDLPKCVCWSCNP